MVTHRYIQERNCFVYENPNKHQHPPRCVGDTRVSKGKAEVNTSHIFIPCLLYCQQQSRQTRLYRRQELCFLVFSPECRRLQGVNLRSDGLSESEYKDIHGNVPHPVNVFNRILFFCPRNLPSIDCWSYEIGCPRAKDNNHIEDIHRVGRCSHGSP